MITLPLQLRRTFLWLSLVDDDACFRRRSYRGWRSVFDGMTPGFGYVGDGRRGRTRRFAGTVAVGVVLFFQGDGGVLKFAVWGFVLGVECWDPEGLEGVGAVSHLWFAKCLKQALGICWSHKRVLPRLGSERSRVLEVRMNRVEGRAWVLSWFLSYVT